MLYTLFGLVAAAFFGIIAYSIYGLDGLMERAWIDQVFWGLIALGVVMSALEQRVDCVLCKLRGWFTDASAFCHGAPCTH